MHTTYLKNTKLDVHRQIRDFCVPLEFWCFSYEQKIGTWKRYYNNGGQRFPARNHGRVFEDRGVSGYALVNTPVSMLTSEPRDDGMLQTALIEESLIRDTLQPLRKEMSITLHYAAVSTRSYIKVSISAFQLHPMMLGFTLPMSRKSHSVTILLRAL